MELDKIKNFSLSDETLEKISGGTYEDACQYLRKALGDTPGTDFMAALVGNGYGDFLVSEGYITQEQFDKTLAEYNK